jgi:SAM-dependent methyltransferase|tara:strand:- start:225 stop:890 length:666 start_codon:yes stop_codon:yes gene_type:complete
MKKSVNYISSLHSSTSRSYIERMNDDKINCMLKAKKYDLDYWDGNRKYGYGGYKYLAGRWKPVAEILIKKYNLSNNSSVLDVGCGKAFLLYEMKLLLPGLKISGFDISKYGIAHAKNTIKDSLFYHKAQKVYPFKDKEFDLVISINTLHNLKIFELRTALKEVQRTGKESYICVESYRNEKELFNLECWALTCESFFDPDEWKWIYDHFGYTGDYEFIYFE